MKWVLWFSRRSRFFFILMNYLIFILFLQFACIYSSFMPISWERYLTRTPNFIWAFFGVFLFNLHAKKKGIEYFSPSAHVKKASKAFCIYILWVCMCQTHFNHYSLEFLVFMPKIFYETNPTHKKLVNEEN